jgi:hypothetical protein
VDFRVSYGGVGGCGSVVCVAENDLLGLFALDFIERGLDRAYV